jgi:hypothetical protein
MALVRERTIPTERPPLVGEDSATFCGHRVSRGQGDDPYGRNLGFLYRICYFFYQVAPQLYLRGLVDPVPDQLILESNPDLWICSQEL